MGVTSATILPRNIVQSPRIQPDMVLCIPMVYKALLRHGGRIREAKPTGQFERFGLEFAWPATTGRIQNE